MSNQSNASCKHFQMSCEQEKIIECDADSIKINAFAGCGKSTVLKGYAKKRPSKRYLYLAYNKPIADSASSSFPKNVKCKTTHSLAFEAVGVHYASIDKIGESRASTVQKILGVSVAEAASIQKTVSNFLSSSAPELNGSHIDMAMFHRVNKDSSDVESTINKARKLWSLMCDPTESRILMPHDGYLKLFLSDVGGLASRYDGVMIDEAQDTSEAVSSALMLLPMQKILVGDTHQSINAWRGAVNAMEKFEVNQSLFLTESYRFGHGIASVANRILHQKGDKKQVIGVGGHSTKSGAPVIICRSNATVLDNAIKISKLGKKIFFVGGFSSYRFNKVVDVYHAGMGNPGRCSDVFIKTFCSLDEIEEYAKVSLDMELKQICTVVKKYGASVLDAVSLIKNSSVESYSDANIAIGTVHKCKGLEFPTVALEEDYLDMNKFKSSGGVKMIEEVNLIYVALTRAQNKLITSRQLGEWLNA